jgi:hypothetical protein
MWSSLMWSSLMWSSRIWSVSAATAEVRREATPQQRGNQPERLPRSGYFYFRNQMLGIFTWHGVSLSFYFRERRVRAVSWFRVRGRLRPAPHGFLVAFPRTRLQYTHALQSKEGIERGRASCILRSRLHYTISHPLSGCAASLERNARQGNPDAPSLSDDLVSDDHISDDHISRGRRERSFAFAEPRRALTGPS